MGLLAQEYTRGSHARHLDPHEGSRGSNGRCADWSKWVWRPASCLGGIVLERKYSDAPTGRDAQTIAASPWLGVIVSRSLTKYGDRVDVLPAPVVALLLGS